MPFVTWLHSKILCRKFCDDDVTCAFPHNMILREFNKIGNNICSNVKTDRTTVSFENNFKKENLEELK